MTRLPTPGGDDNNWGDILNSYLEVSLASDGTLNNNVVGTSQIQDSVVTSAKLDSTAQTSLSKANSAVQSVNGKTGSSVSLNAGDISAIPTSQLGAANGVATLGSGSQLTIGQLPSSVVIDGQVEVYAPKATGTAATDTAALAAAISATPAGGTLYLDGHYKINAALSVTQSVKLQGRQKVTYSGLSALPSGPNVLTEVAGAIIEQTVAATDGVDVTIAGGTFHMEDVVVAFSLGLSSTGHGINCDPGSSEVGLYGSTFDGCYVFGHDGNHYGLRIWNALEYTTRDFRSWGGGGMLEGCSSGSINYGNAVHVHPYVSLVNSGSAHGFARSSAAGTTVPVSGGMLNLLTYIRPQCNIAGAAGTAGTQKIWTDSVGAGFPWYVTVISADLEASGFNNTYDYGPDTHFVGSFDFAANGSNPGNESVGYLALGTAGQYTGTQQKSVALGRQALQSMTTGNANAGVGYFALQSLTTGTGDTALGYTAGESVTTGIGNTLIGGSAGYKGGGTSGNAVVANNYNTHVGYQAGPGGSGDYASTVAVGKNALVTGNYSLAVGTGTSAGAAGAVAIGVNHNGTAATTSTQDVIALGTSTHQVQLLNNTTGSGSAALGSNSPATTNTGPYTWFKMMSSDGSTVYVPAWK